MIVIDWLSDICLLLGGILTLTGAVGLLRLPNFYTRLHAASVTESLAATLLIIGIILDTGWALDSAKLLLIIVIMIIANPTITHALCRAAAHGGITPEIEIQNTQKTEAKTETLSKESK
ncbi:MAG: monovalent cation/H(+) antiporter subunit G [Campylobacterota bacterium]|nr:monovalent cation/H(+) antiporter subunit G [Campylobacterota bacterium]